MWKNGLVAGIGLVLLAGWGTAGELRVTQDGSGNYGTIQEAIDAAAPGDVIVVGDGTWQGDGNRDITFRGKTITVRSKSGPDKCIIDCQGGMDYAEFHRGFVFQSEELREAILEGFTITGGVHSTGAGILCSNGSNPTIRGNIIAGNHVPYDWDGGGGVTCRKGAAPLIVGNLIRDNVCEPGGGGGGIHCYESGRVEIEGNVIVNNSSSYGGGIDIGYLGSALVENNLIAGNQAVSAGGVGFWGVDGELSLRNNTIACNQVESNGTGILIGYADDAFLVNCIVWGNYSSAGTNEQIVVEHGSASIRYCCIQDWGDGGTGNIRDDPLFVDAAEGDFHLQVKSPCVNAGVNTAVGYGVTDLDGRPRIQGGTVDMGAYEFTRPRVIYVDDSATGANDGTSWADAYLYLQDALAIANSGDGIRVAQGRYRPDQSAYLDGLIPGDRNASFRLKVGVEIRGGYAGFGEANPDARDIRVFESILSGDLNGNDQGGWYDPTRSENGFNVVTAYGPLSGAVLDGFTITGGYSGPDHYTWGGGLFSHATTGLEIRDCRFQGNFGNEGGGLYDSWSSSCRVTNCVFTNNFSSRGGAVYLNGEECMTLDHCLIVGNQAEWGGGIYLDEAYTSIVNCTVAQNHARDQWGGVIDTPGTSHFWSCIFWDNTCSDGSVEWAQIGRNDGNTAFDYCCVQGWTGQFDGVGTIDADPLFANVAGGDYRLRSQGGRWDVSDKMWMKDTVSSPCIDAGDPYGPIGLEPFPNGGVVNMGFDGGTAEASKSWFGADCMAIYPGDINGDCRVDLADFAILARFWLQDGSGSF